MSIANVTLLTVHGLLLTPGCPYSAHALRTVFFAAACWCAGLVHAEETHGLQHRAAVSLERLQHQRAWNIITLEHQEAAKAAAAGPPAAVSSTGCTSSSSTGMPEPYMAQVREQERGPGVDSGAAKGEQQCQGGLLSDLHNCRSGLSDLRQRAVPRK